MSRTGPRTGGKAAPKRQSPPRESGSPKDASAGSGADALRTRRGQSSNNGGGHGNDDAPDIWQALDNKCLLQSAMHGVKRVQMNVADAAKAELNAPKRLFLHGLSYAMMGPAMWCDNGIAKRITAVADRGLSWSYNKVRHGVAELESVGERVVAGRTNRFAGVKADADAAPGESPVRMEASGNEHSGWLKQMAGVMVLLMMTIVRSVFDAMLHPRDTSDAIKRGVGVATDSSQWKARGRALWGAAKRLWAARRIDKAKSADGKEDHSELTAAAGDLFRAVWAVCTPWRPIATPQPQQQQHPAE